MKGEVKGAKEIDGTLMGRERKQQHSTNTFTRLRKSVEKGCIMALERRARKTSFRGLRKRSYLLGTTLSLRRAQGNAFFNFEGGNGIGFFEPQGILVSS